MDKSNSDSDFLESVFIGVNPWFKSSLSSKENGS
jgi:hypothetical protein